MSDSLQPTWTVAYQAPLSMVFSREVYWSGLPFPSTTNWSQIPKPNLKLLKCFTSYFCSLVINKVKVRPKIVWGLLYRLSLSTAWDLILALMHVLKLVFYSLHNFLLIHFFACPSHDFLSKTCNCCYYCSEYRQYFGQKFVKVL